MIAMLTDETRYHILKHLETQPDISQRELASALNISVGKVNYCLKALIEKGMLKASNFRNSKHKRAYLYKLTPQGIEEKARVTVRFLKQKMAQYEQLHAEIEQLNNDLTSLEKAHIHADK